MGGALARYDGPRSIEELERYTRLMAEGSSILPEQYRRQPGAIMFAVEYAKALDVSPVTAITGIHVIEGKPTASAGLISALIRRAGHTLRVSLEGTVEGGDVRAVVTLMRNDDDHVYSSTWTLRRAVRANLCTTTQDEHGVWRVVSRSRSGKPGAWETYTESMLKARAITEVGRDGAEDVLLGVHYTPEELGVDLDDAGDPVSPMPPASGPTVRAEQVHEEPREEPAKAAPKADDVFAEPPAPSLADRVREAILDAQDEEALVAVWNDPNGINRTKSVAESLTMRDHAGNPTTAFALFIAAGKALRAGSPLRPPHHPTRDAEVRCHDCGFPARECQCGRGPARPAEPKPDPAPAPAPEEPPAQGKGEPVTDHAWQIEQIVEKVGTLPPQDARKALEDVLRELDGPVAEQVIRWVHLQGLNPTTGPEPCAAILAAVAAGDPFDDDTVATFATGGVEEPFLAVLRILAPRFLVLPADDPADPWRHEGDRKAARATAAQLARERIHAAQQQTS